MITSEIIEELYPTLDSLWEHNDRNRYQARGTISEGDIWQVPGYKPVKVVVNLINSLEPVSDMTLLDYGCDVGLHSIVASQKFKKVVAIENDIVSYRRAKVTKEVFERKGYNLSNLEIKNISFKEYDKSDINALLKCDVGGNPDSDVYASILSRVNLVVWKFHEEKFIRKGEPNPKDILKNKYHFNLDYHECSPKRPILVGRK